MKPSTSTGQDLIPMKAIKSATKELSPLLLNLINQTIAMKTYPTRLKTSKIKPIRKKDQDETIPDGWRPVNLIQAISKIIERIYLRQILNHLEENKLINHSHHGGLKNKSTQTAIAEVHDNLVKHFANGIDVALVCIDQSKAFDIIDHGILLDKMKIIGFCTQAIQIMRSFLHERRQYVQVQSQESQCLLTGPRSVVQGSALSGALYLIYMIDLPYITHEEIHEPKEYNECQAPNIKTFIDDCLIKVSDKKNSNLSQEVTKLMTKVEDYASANLSSGKSG